MVLTINYCHQLLRFIILAMIWLNCMFFIIILIIMQQHVCDDDYYFWLSCYV